jgi:hypothetical protein
LSVNDIVFSRLIRHIDEEITTAALLGAMASNIAWASALALKSDLPPFSWIHYSKHGKDEKSEAYTGADFSLIFRMDNNKYRAAVFQAKRAQSEKLNFKYCQISPAREGYLPEPQIIRLYKYGIKLLIEAPRKHEEGDTSLTDLKLDFVHYLIYHQKDAYATPLCDYQNIIDKLQAYATTITAKDPSNLESVREAWKNFADLKLNPSESTISISKLFKTAFLTPATERAPGWIDLETPSAAKLFISETRRLMDVFEGADFATPKPTYDGGMDLVGMANSRQPLLRAVWPKPSAQPQPKSTNTPSKKRF